MGPVVRILNKFPEIACFNLPLLPYPYELEYTTGMKMNIGVSAENDKLPKRLTDVPQDPKNPKTRVPLEQMKKTYYRARGWEKNGLPSEKKLHRLGIF